MKVKKGIKTDFTGIPLDNPFEPESYETNETGETVASHSPLPWRRSSFNDYLVIADSRGCATICDCTNRIFADPREQEENRKFIIKACNAYPHAEKLERDMIAWRSLAQEMTPGGSEFMTPDAVRAFYRQQKDETHQAKKEKSKIKALSEKLAEVLKEVRFSLNACQLVIADATARETVRDLVRQADEALKAWSSNNE